MTLDASASFRADAAAYNKERLSDIIQNPAIQNKLPKTLQTNYQAQLKKHSAIGQSIANDSHGAIHDDESINGEASLTSSETDSSASSRSKFNLIHSLIPLLNRRMELLREKLHLPQLRKEVRQKIESTEKNKLIE